MTNDGGGLVASASIFRQSIRLFACLSLLWSSVYPDFADILITAAGSPDCIVGCFDGYVFGERCDAEDCAGFAGLSGDTVFAGVSGFDSGADVREFYGVCD